MRPAPGPEVILTKESRSIKPRENLRHFLIAVAVVLSIGIIFYTLITHGDQIQNSLATLSSTFRINQLIASVTTIFQAKPKVAREGNAARMLNQDFTAVYIADLEYDPKTGVTRQINTGAIRGDTPRFLSNQPKPAANKFIYRVEVLSDPKEILSSGWFTEYKDVIQAKDGKLNFRVVVAYRPNSIIKVYLPDKKLLWTGQTNKKETII